MRKCSYRNQALNLEQAHEIIGELENELLEIKKIMKYISKDLNHTLYYSGIHRGKQTWFLARNINIMSKEIEKIVN